MPVQIVYFAQVREVVGIDGEQFDASPDMPIAAFVDQLAQQSERHAAAFADRSKLRFALDQKMVRPDALLDDARELAIFPPVTGG